MHQIAIKNKKLGDHKSGLPVHLANNNNTSIQPNGAKMAAERTAVARPVLLCGACFCCGPPCICICIGNSAFRSVRLVDCVGTSERIERLLETEASVFEQQYIVLLGGSGSQNNSAFSHNHTSNFGIHLFSAYSSHRVCYISRIRCKTEHRCRLVITKCGEFLPLFPSFLPSSHFPLSPFQSLLLLLLSLYLRDPTP